MDRLYSLSPNFQDCRSPIVVGYSEHNNNQFNAWNGWAFIPRVTWKMFFLFTWAHAFEVCREFENNNCVPAYRNVIITNYNNIVLEVGKKKYYHTPPTNIFWYQRGCRKEEKDDRAARVMQISCWYRITVVLFRNYARSVFCGLLKVRQKKQINSL